MKKIGLFIGDFILTHFIWIVPITYFLIFNKLPLRLIFGCSLVTIIYCSIKNKFPSLFQPVRGEISIKKFSIWIDLLYYITVFLFLFLTGWATYEGIGKILGIGRHIKTFQIIFAIGIPLALFGIILIIKSRKTPMLIVAALILYILFDGLTALPFNYLFFYEHLTENTQLEKDENLFNNIIKECNLVVTSKIQQADSTIQRYDLQIADKTKQDSIRLMNEYNWQIAIYEKNINNAPNDSLKNIIERKKSTYMTNYNKKPGFYELPLKDKEIYLNKQSISKKYHSIKNSLDVCYSLKNTYDNIGKGNSLKVQTGNQLKHYLDNICAQTQDSLLLTYRNDLRPYKPSSFESIKEFYKWFFNNVFLFNINENKKDLPGKNETAISGKEEEDREWNNAISLALSIVIDILPLLYSLLYILYRKND